MARSLEELCARAVVLDARTQPPFVAYRLLVATIVRAQATGVERQRHLRDETERGDVR